MRVVIIVAMFLAPLNAQNPLWIDLSGEWRMVAGDRPEFASADFDDRRQPTLVLPSGVYNRLDRMSRRYWLRRRVDLPAGADRASLALTLGVLQSVYEVYVNGQRIGASGHFETFADAQVPRPRTFRLPAGIASQGPSLQLAVRVSRALSMTPRWRLPDDGPYLLTSLANAPPRVGEQAIANQRLRDAEENVLLPLLLAIPLLSLLGWLVERRRRELLWFAVAACGYAAGTYYTLALMSVSSYPFNEFGSPRFELAVSHLYLPLYGHFLLVALALGQRWLRPLLWLFGTAAVVAGHLGFHANLIRLYGMSASAAVPLALIAYSWLRQRGDGGKALLLVLPIVPDSLYWLGAGTRWNLLSQGLVLEAGPWRISLGDLSWLCTSSVILALLLHRVYQDLQDRQRLAGELDSARTIQRLLLPDPHVSDALEIKAAYEPAREVGGDFYQILERDDGTRIVLVGDVSGKGLEAAMVAAAAVGAFRGLDSDSPAALLAGLNRALTGHGRTGFVTCCCARLEPDGKVVFASAGHPVPYLDGRELECQSGLPLGVVVGSTYRESESTLALGSQVTFVSDGVVEAASADGELFGFDRTREISGKSASEIAAAAKAWGQNDDITVVTVRRMV